MASSLDHEVGLTGAIMAYRSSSSQKSAYANLHRRQLPTRVSSRTKGLVQIYDVIGFDEVADLEKMLGRSSPSTRPRGGQEAASGEASGNTNQPIEILVQTGHLFEPMPTMIHDDMALIDSLRFYLQD